jgi:hypothetical protein
MNLPADLNALSPEQLRTVAAKTEDQQVMLSLHCMRSLLVKFRTMQINQLRGLLYELTLRFRAGRVAGLDEIRKRMAELEDALPRSPCGATLNGDRCGQQSDWPQRVIGWHKVLQLDRREQRFLRPARVHYSVGWPKPIPTTCSWNAER